jgi:hypothetical protein
MKKERGKRREVGESGIDEMLPEYDFRKARPNKYAAGSAEGGAVLRAMAGIIRKHRPHKTATRGDAR